VLLWDSVLRCFWQVDCWLLVCFHFVSPGRRNLLLQGMRLLLKDMVVVEDMLVEYYANDMKKSRADREDLRVQKR